MTEDDVETKRVLAMAAALEALTFTAQRHSEYVKERGPWPKSAEAVRHLATAYALLARPDTK